MAEKKLKTQYNYDRVGKFSDGMAIVSQNNKYGFIDADGREAIPPIYDYAYDFKNGSAEVKFQNKWRVIDKTGKVVAKYDVPQINTESSGVGLIRMSDGIVAETLTNGFTKVQKDKKWGLINSEGNEVILPKYDAIEEFNDQLIMVKSGRKWGLADKLSGKEVVAPKYDEISKPSKDGIPVRISDKWGLIDESGNEIKEPQFYNRNNLFKKDVVGFTDKSGNKSQCEWD
jgi:hypothetical protein